MTQYMSQTHYIMKSPEHVCAIKYVFLSIEHMCYIIRSKRLVEEENFRQHENMEKRILNVLSLKENITANMVCSFCNTFFITS